MRVLVVGAGLGGLAAAAHLVGRGFDVTVLERDTRPGGRAGLVERDGFRLDNGPTVLTMPDLLAETFAAAGADMRDHLTLRPVDPMYRAVYADGSVLHVRNGREAMTEEIRGFAGPDAAAAFGRFADWVTELYALEMPNFIDADFDTALDLVRRWRAGARLVRLGGFGRLGAKVASFFDDERLQRIFGFQSMYAGVAPYEALALYAVITYMDSIAGVFVPDGGMHAVATALADAVTGGGAKIRYDVAVTRVLRDGAGAVRGVELAGGERVDAEVVVCNPDLPVVYRTLLGGLDAPRVARRGRYSPSCLLWVAGVRGLPPADAAHHNIHFGRQWDESFRALIGDGEMMPDPSILVTLHALDDATLAPPGCSTLYALEPTPNLDGRVDWTVHREPALERLQAQVAAAGYPVDVVTEQVYDPLDWEAMGMERGTPFALAHTFRQTGPFRPRNTDRRAPGLVFVGSSTVPGVGVPMVLVSGKLAADRVEHLATARGRR
ncbi:MAG: phytoene desaturase family protein [Actinomycetota bacterium]|nr:phytoene desaturase [Acidimicrobiia bacterium]MDQ3470235.1 phytoene desaturase family protein [Actinomycetota bacterium]